MNSAILEQKTLAVSEIKELLEKSQSAVLVDYRGLSVEEDTELRRQFRKAGVVYRVQKNTLIRRAADQLGLQGLVPHLEGPTAIAYGIDDPAAPAKVLTEYIKKTKKMNIKVGVVDGQVIDASGVQYLADLPPREVLIAKMLGSMNAPITGLVTVLGGTLKSLLYTLNAVKDQKSA